MSTIYDNVVYFAHGRDSAPWGTKIKELAKVARARGFQVESPDYRETMDPLKRVEMLLNLAPEARQNLVLYGSSMGAYVSIAASKELQPQGLFVVAPAIFPEETDEPFPVPEADLLAGVHGWYDDVVPVDNVIPYAREHDIELRLVNDGHRLIESLPQIINDFDRFLKSVLVEVERPTE